MLRYSPIAGASNATSVRVAGITIEDTTFKNTAQSDYVALLLRILEDCVVPAEQRLHAHFGSNGDIPASLVKIEVTFPWDKNVKASILGPLTTGYPALVRSLRVLTIAYNAYNESDALGAFARLATQLQELTFRWWLCGLTSVQGLEGRCEYLRKVDLWGCENLTSIDALADRVYLEEVDASRTGITSIEPLRSCPNLTMVDVFSCGQLPADARLMEGVRVFR